jgi:threonine aldolase
MGVAGPRFGDKMRGMIDLRSDTVTRPTAPMREAMAHAEVGDDVYGEDPTVRRLEETVAGLLGKEAALFVPSGTMGNQLAILTSTRRGDEVVCGEGAHLSLFEAGAAAALSGVQFTFAGKGGFFDVREMEAAVKPHVYYVPRTSLVTLENTHNVAGGRIFPPADVAAITRRARELGLRLHLDGARLWNASAASGVALSDLAEPFDTVSVCFSKGLGAPIGSALAGSRLQMEDARRLRKMLGAGMRQTGIIAAAALYGITHHRARLDQDHEHARLFHQKLRDGLDLKEVTVLAPETNIVSIDLPATIAEQAMARAKADGLLISAIVPTRLRAVFHLDVARAETETAAETLIRAIRAASGAR